MLGLTLYVPRPTTGISAPVLSVTAGIMMDLFCNQVLSNRSFNKLLSMQVNLFLCSTEMMLPLICESVGEEEFMQLRDE